jgi:hypothetical protein
MGFMDDVIVAITSGVVVLVLIALFLWAKKRRQVTSGEPIIGLEKLVNCRSCGSSIPEGARKCAFCGAVQKGE